MTRKITGGEAFLSVPGRRASRPGRPSTDAGDGRRTAALAAPADRPPTHEEIAARAQALWRARQCPVCQDEQIWIDAEAQLRAERSDVGAYGT